AFLQRHAPRAAGPVGFTGIVVGVCEGGQRARSIGGGLGRERAGRVLQPVVEARHSGNAGALLRRVARFDLGKRGRFLSRRLACISLPSSARRLAILARLARNPLVGGSVGASGLNRHLKRMLVGWDESAFCLLEQAQRPRSLAVGQTLVDGAAPDRRAG